MKPIYNECTHKWRVKNLGAFDTPKEAWRAIYNTRKTEQLLIMIDKPTKEKLKQLSISRNMSISSIVRIAIENEVNRNE